MNKNSGSLHITKKVDYGFYLLSCLIKESGSQLSIKTIADESKISFPFLQKVARHLQQAKIIHAARGKYGGYSLAKAANKITLKDVIEALDGPVALTPCLKKGATKAACPRMCKCVVRTGLISLNEQIRDTFLSRPLSEIIS